MEEWSSSYIWWWVLSHIHAWVKLRHVIKMGSDGLERFKLTTARVEMIVIKQNRGFSSFSKYLFQHMTCNRMLSMRLNELYSFQQICFCCVRMILVTNRFNWITNWYLKSITIACAHLQTSSNNIFHNNWLTTVKWLKTEIQKTIHILVHCIEKMELVKAFKFIQLLQSQL